MTYIKENLGNYNLTKPYCCLKSAIAASGLIMDIRDIDTFLGIHVIFEIQTHTHTHTHTHTYLPIYLYKHSLGKIRYLFFI